MEWIDPSDRYFSRALLVSRTGSGYSGKIMYEALTVQGGSHSTIGAAVREVVEAVQKHMPYGFVDGHPPGFARGPPVPESLGESRDREPSTQTPHGAGSGPRGHREPSCGDRPIRA